MERPVVSLALLVLLVPMTLVHAHEDESEPTLRVKRPSERTVTVLPPESDSIDEVTVPPDAIDLAIALGIPEEYIVSATTKTSDTRGTGVGDAPLGRYFPIESETFTVLSTGKATEADRENLEENLTTTLDGLNNENGHDMVQFWLELQVPEGVNCAGFDFAFYSEEYDEFLNSEYNDTFTAEKGDSDLSIVGNEVIAPNNFAFDEDGDIISVNTSFGTSPDTESTYDGVTPLLHAETPVDPGTVEKFIFTVQDLGDSLYDSAVFLDAFRFSKEVNCADGSQNTLEKIDRSIQTEEAAGNPHAPVVSKPQGGWVDFVVTVTNEDPENPQENLDFAEPTITPAYAIDYCVRYATDDMLDWSPNREETVNRLGPKGEPDHSRRQVFRCKIADAPLGAGEDILTVDFETSVLQGSENESEPLVTSFDVVRTSGIILITNQSLLYKSIKSVREVRLVLNTMYRAVDGHAGVVVYADLDQSGYDPPEPGEDVGIVGSWDWRDTSMYSDGTVNNVAERVRDIVALTFDQLTAVESILGFEKAIAWPKFLGIVGSEQIIPMYKYPDPIPCCRDCEANWLSTAEHPIDHAFENNYIPIDDYYRSPSSADFEEGDGDLFVGRVVGQRMEDDQGKTTSTRAESLARLLTARSVDDVRGQVVVASSDGLNLDGPADTLVATGFDVLNDTESDDPEGVPGTIVTVNTETWTKETLRRAINRGVDAVLLCGHSRPEFIAINSREPNTAVFDNPGYETLVSTDLGDDEDEINSVGATRPFVISCGCHNGVFRGDASHVGAWLGEGASAFIGNTGYGISFVSEGYDDASYTEALLEEFAGLFFSDADLRMRIGEAVGKAKRSYLDAGWFARRYRDEPSAQKTMISMQLHGLPWLYLNKPGGTLSDDSEEREAGYDVVVGTPEALSDDRIRIPISVTVTDWNVENQSGWDIVRIPGGPVVGAIDVPRLPALDVFRMAKPRGYSLESIVATPSDRTELGPLNVPAFKAHDLESADTGSVVYATPTTAGTTPDQAVDVMDAGREILISLMPVAHEVPSQDTWIDQSWDIDLVFFSDEDVLIDEIEAPSGAQGARALTVPVDTTVRNLSDVGRTFTVEIEIEGDVAESEATVVGPGEAVAIPTSWVGDLDAGGHDVKATVLEGGAIVSAGSDVLISEVGLLRSITGPDEVAPGSLATFTVTVENLDSQSMDVEIDHTVLDSEGVVVGGGTETQPVAGNSTADIDIDWNTEGSPEGNYRLVVRVDSPYGPWGSGEHPFAISSGNTPPEAEAGPAQTVSCDAEGTGTATLDGSGSRDADGDTLYYAWRGPFLENGGLAGGVQPTLTFPEGTHEVELTVEDALDESVPDYVTVTVQPVDYYVDDDGDGFGDPERVEAFCTSGPPEGYADNGNDCDDGNANVYPGASEVCDGVLNDCSGPGPDGADEPWYGDPCDGPDSDLCAEGGLICDAGVQECNDVTGDTTEICDNGIDDDCDGSMDEGDCRSLGLVFRADTKNWVEWDQDSSAESYSLYRGEIGANGMTGYTHRCYFSELPEPHAALDAMPWPGYAHYYLAASEFDADGDGNIYPGSLGADSTGAERPDSSSLGCGVRVYVDPDVAGAGGSADPYTATGLTWAEAYTSVSGALVHEKSADRSIEIWVRGDVYDPDVEFGADNTHPGARILGGFSGTETVPWARDQKLNPTAWNGDAGLTTLQVTGKALVIDGIDLRRGTHGVRGTDVSRVELADVSLEDLSQGGLLLETRTDSRLLISGVSLTDLGGDGIRADVRGGKLAGFVRDSLADNVEGRAISLSANALEGTEVVIGVSIEGNRLRDGGAGVFVQSTADNSDAPASTHVSVASNWITGMAGVGIEMMSDLRHANPAAVGCALSAELGATITGNTIADNLGSGIVTRATRDVPAGECPDLGQLRSESQPEIWDNLVTGNGEYAVEEGGQDGAEGVSEDPSSLVGNDLWANAHFYLDDGGQVLDSLGEVNGLEGAAENFAEDARYVDAVGGDYHIEPDSPAVDRGHAGAPGRGVRDIDGEARSRDDNGDGTADPDVGADETGAPGPAVPTSSVEEFSSLQGSANWYYGYYPDRDEDGVVGQSDWEELPVFENARWHIRLGEGGYWTQLRDTNGHPNGTNGNQGRLPELHWAVRRWVSPIEGQVTISGSIDPGSNGGDARLRIIVDGEEVLNEPSIPAHDYSIDVSVQVGSRVDFAIDPDGSDVNDGTVFTAEIEQSSAE